MQLHFSWTVLATIIWTILLDSSAKGTISKEKKLLGLEKNCIGVEGSQIDTSWKLEKTIKTIQYVGPNVETKSPSDITKRRIIPENDMAGKMVGNAVEKHYVRGQSFSQDTPISSKHGRNNGDPGKNRGKDNDGVSIFQHRSKASLKRNILMMHYADGGLRSLNKHQLNVPREFSTERVKPDRASTRTSQYEQKEEAVNAIKTLATSVPLIDGSNTSDVNYQSSESRAQPRILKYDNPEHLTAPKWNGSMEKIGFVRYSSFNDTSSTNDQPLDKEFPETRTNGKHETVSSPEIQDPLPFLRTNNTIENIGKKTGNEKVFSRKVQYLLGNGSFVRQQQPDRNVLGPTQGNLFINGPLESNKILEYETKEKPESFGRQRDRDVSKELRDVETAAGEVEILAKRQLNVQANQRDPAIFTVPLSPANLLDREANRVPEASSLNDASSGLTVSGKVEVKSKGLSGQVGGSSTHVRQSKTDSSMETTNYQGCKHVAKLSFGWRSLPKDFTDRRHLDEPDLSSPGKGESHSQPEFRQGLEKINYLQDGKVEIESVSVSSLNSKDSKRKKDNAGLIEVNKNGRKDFEGLGMNERKNMVTIGSGMSRVNDNNKISRWKQKSDDNPSSQDIKLKVHGKVVKTKLTSSLRDRRAHKTFIGQNSAGDTNLGSYQTPEGKVQLQEPKEYREKLIFDTTPIELNGFLGWQHVAYSVQRTLANSETFSSLWPEVEPENTLSDFNVRANVVGTRKMQLSREDTQDSREIKISKEHSAPKEIFLFPEVSKAEPPSKQFSQASSTESNTSGYSQENRENSIQQIFQPVPTDTSVLMGFPRVQMYPRTSALDRNDHPVHEGDRKITERLESKVTLDREKFHPTPEKDRPTKITLSLLDKSDGEVAPLDPGGVRIQWTIAGPVTSAVGNSKASTTIRKMASAQFDNKFNNKTMQTREHSRGTEIVNKQDNYIGEVQNNDKISMINRSELRDRIESDGDDSLEKRRKERTHSTHRIDKVVDCDPCKATDDVNTKENAPSRTFRLAHYKKRSNKKVARSVTETSVPNSLLPPDITRGNGVSLDPAVTDSPGNSLGATSRKLETFARPEEQADGRVRWTNVEKLVRGQKKMLDEPTTNDFHLSRNSNIEKSRDADDKKSVDKYEKFQIRPLRSNEALRKDRRKEFSDNSDDVSRDDPNLRPFSRSPKGKQSGDVNSVKILVDEETTKTAAMNSMKIDSSISLIDQTSHRVDFPGKKEYIGNVGARISLGGNGEAIGEAYDGKVEGKQMGSGFTKDSVAPTKTTMSHSPDYKMRQKDEINNAAQSSSVDDDVREGAKITNKILIIPVADLTMSNFSSSQSSDPTYSNLTSVSSDPNDSPVTNSSRNLEAGLDQQEKSQSQQAQLRPNNNMEKSIDARIVNQTIYDNSTRVTNTLNQWPVKHSAVVEGDLVLGGLMMVHEREDSVTCGPVMPQGGVQALEAMLYTLDWLNKRDLVPGVKIGAHILDDCDKDTYGLEMAVDFIKGQ